MPNHVRLGTAKVMYLTYRSRGLSVAEALEKTPNVYGSLGVSDDTLARWRKSDTEFRACEERLETEGSVWWHLEVVNPMRLAALDGHDLEHILEIPTADGKVRQFESKRMGGKLRELLSTELKIAGGVTDPTEAFREVLQKLSFEVRPAIDVTPVLDRPALELVPDDRSTHRR